MKIYAEHHKIQDFLHASPIEGVTIVDEPDTADFIVTGRYDDSKYHPGLKGIIIPYTGHNNVNLDDLRKRNMMLFVTPTRSKWVAEKAVTLTLALLGNTIMYHEQLKEGNWSQRNTEKRLPWTSIIGKKVGLFGYGRIGTLIHEFLKGFGCEFYTIDRGKIYPKGIKPVPDLTTLIRSTDIVIISAPINHETEGIFNEAILSQMKDKFLINVGRGKIVDEAALYQALKTKHLAGYASDVWYLYPKGKERQLPSEYPLYELDNVVMSNHSGGFTYETNDEVNQDLLQHLQDLRDHDYSNKLDLEKLI